MDRDSAEKRIIEACKKIDVNGDGYLSRQEIIASFRNSNARVSESQVDELIKNLDTDKDGRVSYQEVIDAALG